MSPDSQGSLAWLEAAESHRSKQDPKLGSGAGVSWLVLVSPSVKWGDTGAFYGLWALLYKWESSLKMEKGPWTFCKDFVAATRECFSAD